MGNLTLNDDIMGRLKGRRWLVGVSGGGDSVALLRLLVDAGLTDRLVVGNFEHGWGDFGRESAAFVARLAAEQGLAFAGGAGGGKAVTNAEAVARGERYAWFEQVVRERGLDGVLVAHTRDDMVEGFLMRAGKGSGLRGLAGMGVVGDWRGMVVLRPLLSAGREDLRAYLREQGQEWMEDPDNEAGGSQRARVRGVIPQLEAAGVSVEGLAASMAALRDAEAALAAVVDGFVFNDSAKGSVELELVALRGVEVEIGVRVLGRIMEQLHPHTMVVRRGKRVALLERLKLEDSGAATLGGVKFEWKKGVLTARKE